jgi:cardiolipin synthase (CMP-forming)
MIKRNEIFTLSNFISFLRLLLTIPLWFLLDHLYDDTIRYLTFGICLFAAGTDILDGYIARRNNEVTEVGKIIDPLADKLAIGVIVVKLFIIGEIPAYYFFMILGRDALIFIGGIILTKKIGKVLPSNMLGKITVIVIGIVILMILLQVNYGIIYNSVYFLSILLIIVSLIVYIGRGFEFLKRKNYGSI